MPTVADVLRAVGGRDVERFSTPMPGRRRKVLHAITHAAPANSRWCIHLPDTCGEIHAMSGIVRQPALPDLQHGKTKAWLDKQTDRLLPCPYFLVTFTLPAELRRWAEPSARGLCRAVRGVQPGAASLAANPRFVGTDRLGFFGVLHTCSGPGLSPARALVVPGGGIDEDGSRWLPSRANYLVR